MKVLITRLDAELPLPSYAKPGDAGADLYSRIDLELAPGERALIPTGISICRTRSSEIWNGDSRWNLHGQRSGNC